jgi:alpha-aminoadipic semialdehyde synthase
MAAAGNPFYSTTRKLLNSLRFFSTTSSSYEGNGVIGIVRESYTKWERRVPLTPEQVRTLVRDHGYTVQIQPSNKRIFTNKEYEAAGATVQDDLSEACLILGVKQVEVREGGVGGNV